jgi:hypothetical protein
MWYYNYFEMQKSRDFLMQQNNTNLGIVFFSITLDLLNSNKLSIILNISEELLLD